MLRNLVREQNGRRELPRFAGIMHDSDKLSTEDRNLIALCKRWEKQDDCDGKRLIGKISDWYGQQNPAIKAILGDNAESFKQVVNESNTIPLLSLFEAACICGSENVAACLKDQIDILKSKYAVAYALSSGKKDFALDIARFAKEKGQQEPPPGVHLYGNCGYSVAEEVYKLFISSQDMPNPNC